MAISRIRNTRLSTLSPNLQKSKLDLLQQALSSARYTPKAPATTLSEKAPGYQQTKPRSTTPFQTSKQTATRLAQATGTSNLRQTQSQLKASSSPTSLGAAPQNMPGTGATQLQTAANAAAAASGGTATGTQTPGGVQDPTGTGKSKFAQSFKPDAAAMMFQNPEALIRAYYDFMKYDTGGGELAMSQGQNAENLLLNSILFGEGRDLSKNPNGNQFGPYADFAGGYLENARTPGGNYYGADQILAALSGDPSQSSTTAYQNLYNDALTPDQQAGNYIYAYSTAAAPSTSREALSAQIAYLSTLEQKFMAEKARGEHEGQNFGQYLHANGWG